MEISSFEELQTHLQPPDKTPLPSLDAYGRAYATGKRKNAIARVWLQSGTGKRIINGRTPDRYFARATLCMLIEQPLVITQRHELYDVWCTVKGGGTAGQASALRHGIAKALLLADPNLRNTLKSHQFLTRDSRIVERKKYGRRKARRRFQFSKR